MKNIRTALKDVITADMLVDETPREVAVFKLEWPDGMEMTAQNMDWAGRLGFDVDWWEYRLSEQRKAAQS